MRRALVLGATFLVAIGAQHTAAAQPRPAATPQTPRSSAPIDLTGYWVAVVSEDWRHRMATPRKGDFESLPLNAEGRRVANEWDLAADNAAGMQCKAFGVGGLMRQPGPPAHHVGRRRHAANRLRRRHADAAARARVRCAAPCGRADVARILARRVATAAGRQPESRARADRQQHGPDRAGRRRPRPARRPAAVGLVDRGRRIDGRHDGIPRGVSAQERRAVQRERHDHRVLPSPAGGRERRLWLHVLTIVEDPRYLSDRFLTSTHFKREPNGSKWNPTECRTAPPPPPRHPRPFRMFAAKPHSLLVPFDGSFDIRKARTEPGKRKADWKKLLGRRGQGARRGAIPALRSRPLCRAARVSGARCSRQGQHDSSRVLRREPMRPARRVVQGAEPPELAHDFLWRTTPHLPERGNVAIFNRSYYEEALVVRVHPELLAAQKLPGRPRRRSGTIGCARSPSTSGISRSREP